MVYATKIEEYKKVVNDFEYNFNNVVARDIDIV